jgi:hypothetical protein
MLSKSTPVEYNIGTVVPGDLVVVRFKSQEDESHKVKKSSLMRSEIKYKSVNINVDLHIHYYVEGGKKEKTASAGVQSVWTSNDGSIREHRMVFVVPGFDRLAKACIYISTDSLSVIQLTDIGIQSMKEIELENEKKLVFVSTWGIKCGIATYTSFLVDAIKNVKEERTGWEGEAGSDNKSGIEIDVVPVNEGVNVEMVYARMVNIQHEFGMMPSPPRVGKTSKCIVTFHTVMTDVTEDGLGVDSLIGMGMGKEVEIAVGGGGVGRGMGMRFTLKRFESGLNIVGYIVHNKDSARVLKRWTKKDVHVIPHGSYKIPDISIEAAREMLGMKEMGIGADDKIGFIFGFQSYGKNYSELADVAKRVGMKLIISGAKHERIKKNILDSNVIKDRNVIFLDRFLTELEVNLYALASDVLLFNYPKQDHYSVSGALHRVIGARRPCILSDTRHFADVNEYDDGVLKFIPGDKGDLERKILEGLEKGDELGQKARDYAERTSWENVAKEHLRIYQKYVNFDDKKEGKEKKVDEVKDEVKIDEVKIDEVTE